MKSNPYKALDSSFIGEARESVVFEALQRMAFDSSSSMLVMHGLKLPFAKCQEVKNVPVLTTAMTTFIAAHFAKKPCKCTKGSPCTCQLGENDFLVLVPRVGAVVLEVKASAKQTTKAVGQLDRMEDFLNIACNVQQTARSWIRNLPCVKVVCVPTWGSDQKAPEGKDPKDGIWHLHKNAMGDFPTWWDQIIADLTAKSANNGQRKLIASNFQHFVGLMAGLWSMKTFNWNISYTGMSTHITLLVRPSVTDYLGNRLMEFSEM